MQEFQMLGNKKQFLCIWCGNNELYFELHFNIVGPQTKYAILFWNPFVDVMFSSILVKTLKLICNSL